MPDDARGEFKAPAACGTSGLSVHCSYAVVHRGARRRQFGSEHPKGGFLPGDALIGTHTIELRDAQAGARSQSRRVVRLDQMNRAMNPVWSHRLTEYQVQAPSQRR